eukprot:4644416-Alexandrium_andersonii.AAC.1
MLLAALGAAPPSLPNALRNSKMCRLFTDMRQLAFGGDAPGDLIGRGDSGHAGHRSPAAASETQSDLWPARCQAR